MILLLDTHTFLWYCQDHPLLSSTAKALLEDSSNAKFVSVASCWEIAIKAGLGKLRLGSPHELSATYIPAALSQSGLRLLPIELVHTSLVETLPHHHRDPFDRLIIAQALSEGCPVVSADIALDPYGVTRLW